MQGRALAGVASRLTKCVGSWRPVPACTRSLCDASGAAAAGGDVNGVAADGKTIDDERVKVISKPEEYDIAIVGGGMVGLAVACALSWTPLTKHLRVAIVDDNSALNSKTYLERDAVPDARVSTITPATISFLKEIGAWKHVLQQRHAFFDKMQVWDYTGLGYTRYSAMDVGKDYLGCVVENKVLCNSLLLRLQEEREGPETVVYPAKLATFSFPLKSKQAQNVVESAADGAPMEVSPSHAKEQIGSANLVKLDLSDGQTFYAKLVVGADGARSHVRELAGLNTVGWKYSQSAIICTVEHASENYCAWQRFLPMGPIALLPIGDKFSNIVWTMKPEDALRHKAMSGDDFVKSVNRALDFGYGQHPRSSPLEQYMERLLSFAGSTAASTKEPFEAPPRVLDVVSARLAFPLSLMHARSYVSQGVALVGDAAHAVHPLAGQGVNLGFGDAASFAKVIADGISVGSDISNISLLGKYEKDRKAANVAMMAILDGFQKAYSVDFAPFNLLRAAAFRGAQHISPLKKNIISYAMGDQKLPLFI